MKKSKRKSVFSGKVKKNAIKTKSGKKKSRYLNIPENVLMFAPEPDSRVKFDILPYTVTTDKHPDKDEKYGVATKGSLWYKRPFKVHRNVGPDKLPIICPRSIGKKCPICDYKDKRAKQGADWDEIKLLKPSLRNLYVLKVKDKEFDKKAIYIWDVSQYLFQNLLTEEIEENEDYETFPDLKEGYTLKVRFGSGSIGGGKAFAEASRIDFYEREKPYSDSILDKVPNLDELLEVKSYKEIEALFFDDELNDDEEEVDDDIYEDEEDTEDDIEEDDIEEDDEEDTEEDDEEDEDDTEEDEEDALPFDETEDEEEEEVKEEKKPKRTRKSKGKKEQKAKKSKKCPYGHIFGKDTDSYDDCDTCIEEHYEVWEECDKAFGE